MRGFEVLCHVDVSTVNPKMKDREEDSVMQCVKSVGPSASHLEDIGISVSTASAQVMEEGQHTSVLTMLAF
jgi:hypothetical protein